MKNSKYIVDSPSYDGNSTIYYNIVNGIGIKVDNGLMPEGGALSDIRSDKLHRFLSEYHFVVDENLDESEKIVSDYKERRETSPFHLVVMPHENCNFRCIYCYEKFERNKMSQQVEDNLSQLVTKKLQSCTYKALSVSWFGGEPLLAKDTIHRLSTKFEHEAALAGIPYVATITTNGYLLDDETISMLLEHHVISFQVTVDGIKECHDHQRLRLGGQPTYDQIISNLLRLKARPERFRVLLRMNVGPENLKTVNLHLEQMKALFGDDPRFVMYFHNISKWGGENDENMDVCTEPNTVDLIHKTIDVGMNVDSMKEFIAPNSTCYAASPHSFVIGSDGMVYKCTVALYEDFNQVGTLNSNGDLELSEEKMGLWTQGGINDSGCHKCHLNPSCHGDSCPLIRIQKNTRPCPPWKNNEQVYIQGMDRQGHRFVHVRAPGGRD